MPTGHYERKLRGKRIVLRCESCNKEMQFLESVLRVRKVIKFCSLACRGIGQRKKGAHITIKCDSCGGLFTKRTDHKKTKNYCSIKCMGVGKQKAGAWSKTNPDKDARREYHRNYVKENREKINSLSSEWAKNNRAYRNYIQQIRRAVGTLTYKEWVEIIKSSDGCAHCGSKERLEVDHKIAVTKGGKTEKDNMQVLCRSCNASKGSGDKPNTPAMASVQSAI